MEELLCPLGLFLWIPLWFGSWDLHYNPQNSPVVLGWIPQKEQCAIAWEGGWEKDRGWGVEWAIAYVVPLLVPLDTKGGSSGNKWFSLTRGWMRVHTHAHSHTHLLMGLLLYSRGPSMSSLHFWLLTLALSICTARLTSPLSYRSFNPQTQKPSPQMKNASTQ